MVCTFDRRDYSVILPIISNYLHLIEVWKMLPVRCGKIYQGSVVNLSIERGKYYHRVRQWCNTIIKTVFKTLKSKVKSTLIKRKEPESNNIILFNA